ncbi:hypothetical protein FLO80_02180 [Aquicoccus porphyridii]|uniref:Uncharacterized protein n=1 Tax=Aquicoccus porphyridii TaxID=1852029 RepID=A0A5A9ZVD8_9RHOB|nr:DUF6614 family protein [Aquicoccus porphyridii]KAA0921001.1 hypothetical protein FLO80_02180 [Aquicoccus porphyridii]RAI56462.1 hypothetical protein DOO74_00900 [Rhodobacteraceae bacterium AsT-22]
MNLYTCSIDLANDAKALAFAHAVSEWMGFLQAEGVIGHWRLFRRKLNLASDSHRDFILHIEVADLAQLDRAFRLSGSHDDHVATLYSAVNTLIAQEEFGLYRPFPDPERAERMALL